MKKPLAENVFPFLALGLAKYAEQEQKYPYPPELLYALNQLSLAMLTAFPRTISDLFELFAQPLEQWWPGDTLPLGIDPRFELLYEGELDYQVIDFLLEYNLPAGANLQDLQVILDNQLMINILNTSRHASITDSAGANSEYVAIRQYVITHPWTTSEALRQQFRTLRYSKIQEVGALYQDSRSSNATLLYQRPEMPAACYWNCTACGPLYQRNNRLGSIKPSACAGRCPGPQGWQKLDPLSNTLVLKRGIHLRTHIPGIIEIQLYRWLTNDIQPTELQLQQVVLWPGVDRYDLLLRFQDGTWAVDVKDYKSPFALGKHIAQDNRHVAESSLEWKCWFYVYPSYRELQRPDYAAHVRRAAGPLPSNVVILNEKQFKARVTSR
ncbi:MAG TPA: hypothetical protein VNG51_13575 [Ktedonobacteraceae bacterium]|nr:hypothetical protein [Ktedonobacteraceae bacterium]